MENELKQLCEKFISNKVDMKENFKWQNRDIINVCAFLFTSLDKKIDSEKILNAKNIFKENVGIFSNLRGNCRNQIICLLSLSDNPTKKIQVILNMYKHLKKYFPGTEYIVLASALLCDVITVDKYDEVFTRAKGIYKLMKKEHRFLTSSEDIVMCLLLSLVDKDDQKIIEETEMYFSILKPTFKSNNSRQSLAHIMTLQNADMNKSCEKASDIFNGLKEKKIKFGETFELPSLALLVYNDFEVDKILSDFIEVDNYLKNLKEYSWVSVSSKVRYTHVCMLLSKYYGLNDSTSATVINTSVLTMLLIQQSANMAMTASFIMMSTAASSSCC